MAVAFAKDSRFKPDKSLLDSSVGPGHYSSMSMLNTSASRFSKAKKTVEPKIDDVPGPGAYSYSYK